MNEPIEVSGVLVHCAHTDIVEVKDVHPNPGNPNQHDKKQIKLLAKIIKEQGWRAPITISRRSGLVVRGHGRLEAAKRLKLTHVPVDYQDYKSDEAELADLLADNRISELSSNDNDLLKDMLQEIDTGAFDMALTGYDESELEKLMTQYHVEEEEKEDAKKPDEGEKKKIVCPHCLHEFDIFTINKGNKTAALDPGDIQGGWALQ